MWTSPGSAAVLLSLAACGNAALDPGVGNAAGTGTATLTVVGEASASPREANASTAADFDTDFKVKVSFNNNTVTTGIVTVTSSTGKVALTYDKDHDWSGTAAGYDEVYVLDVVHGDDRVEGVRVDGPDIHVFTQPTNNASVDAAAPLLIMWQRAQPADAATLRIESGRTTTIDDAGSYTLPAGTLKTERSQTRRHKLRLTRTNQVSPEGSAPDSAWSVTIENTIEVVTPPVPL